MDTTKFGESQFINAELIEQSPTKRVQVKNEGKIETNSYGNEQLVLTVELDQKLKQWSTTMDNVKTMQQSFGKDSKVWIGREVDMKVIMVNGKKRVIAIPCTPKEERVV